MPINSDWLPRPPDFWNLDTLYEALCSARSVTEEIRALYNKAEESNSGESARLQELLTRQSFAEEALQHIYDDQEAQSE